VVVEFEEPAYEELKSQYRVQNVEEFVDSDVVEQAQSKYGWSGVDKYCTTGKQYILMANFSIKSTTL